MGVLKKHEKAMIKWLKEVTGKSEEEIQKNWEEIEKYRKNEGWRNRKQENILDGLCEHLIRNKHGSNYEQVTFSPSSEIKDFISINFKNQGEQIVYLTKKLLNYFQNMDYWVEMKNYENVFIMSPGADNGVKSVLTISFHEDELRELYMGRE